MATISALAAAAAASVASAGGPRATSPTKSERFFSLLVANHMPGAGGVIEDVFLGLLTVCTVYSLWRSSLIPAPVGNPIARKSRTRASWAHVISAAARCHRTIRRRLRTRVSRDPGVDVDVGLSALFLTNALTYSPLMAIFKASKEGKYAMKLGYSSWRPFRGGVHRVVGQPDAPDWMYWAMPFWYFSIAKLWESAEFVLALAPTSERRASAAKRRSWTRSRRSRGWGG